MNVSSTAGYMLDSRDFYHLPPYLDSIFLQRKYVVEGLSLAQIAALIFSSKDAVRRGLKKAGIKIREPHVPHNGRQSQPRFGQWRIKGKVIELKIEQRVIDAIREMNGNGLSLRAISRCLAKMQIATKCRGKKWHPEMVKRILEADQKGSIFNGQQPCNAH
jgi:hypothetical protein